MLKGVTGGGCGGAGGAITFAFQEMPEISYIPQEFDIENLLPQEMFPLSCWGDWHIRKGTDIDRLLTWVEAQVDRGLRPKKAPRYVRRLTIENKPESPLVNAYGAALRSLVHFYFRGRYCGLDIPECQGKFEQSMHAPIVRLVAYGRDRDLRSFAVQEHYNVLGMYRQKCMREQAPGPVEGFTVETVMHVTRRMRRFRMGEGPWAYMDFNMIVAQLVREASDPQPLGAS